MVDFYLAQSPIIPVILAVLAFSLAIAQSFVKKKFQFVRFTISALLTFSAVLILIFYKDIIDSKDPENQKMYMYFGYGALWLIDSVAIIMLFTLVDVSLSNESFQTELKKTLDKTKLYVILNKKDKIKEISTCFLKELNINLKDAVNKNFFDVIELKYYLVGLNDNECLKDDIKKYYAHYEKKVKEGQKRHIELEMKDNHAIRFSMYFDESVIFSGGAYRGRILIGQKKDTESLMGLEKKEAEAKSEASILKSRFTSIINNSNDGIFFHTFNNNSIWVNDTIVKKLNLNGNSLTTDDFFAYFNESDLRTYKEKIASLDDEDYEITYRYNIGSYYRFVREKGHKIIKDGVIELCGTITVNDDNSFEHSGTYLDEIKREDALRNTLREFYSVDRQYQIAHFRVSSIPEINEKYGRETGNMCLAQYVERIKDQYVDDNLIFRVGGIDFVCVIINYNSMEKLRSALRNNESILHAQLNYINEKIKIDANMGLCASTEGQTYNDVLKNAKDCMVYASNPKYTQNYIYYKDLQK